LGRQEAKKLNLRWLPKPQKTFFWVVGGGGARPPPIWGGGGGEKTGRKGGGGFSPTVFQGGKPRNFPQPLLKKPKLRGGKEKKTIFFARTCCPPPKVWAFCSGGRTPQRGMGKKKKIFKNPVFWVKVGSGMTGKKKNTGWGCVTHHPPTEVGLVGWVFLVFCFLLLIQGEAGFAVFGPPTCFPKPAPNNNTCFVVGVGFHEKKFCPPWTPNRGGKNFLGPPQPKKTKKKTRGLVPQTGGSTAQVKNPTRGGGFGGPRNWGTHCCVFFGGVMGWWGLRGTERLSACQLGKNFEIKTCCFCPRPQNKKRPLRIFFCAHWGLHENQAARNGVCVVLPRRGGNGGPGVFGFFFWFCPPTNLF